MADNNAKNEKPTYDAAGHHRPRGPRGSPQAPRHVHRLDRRPGPSPPRSTRSWTTPSTRRWPARPITSRSSSIPDNSVTVTDNGRGIPVDDRWRRSSSPAAEVVLTVLHAGGKFGDGGGYKVSGGLHGVGVSVVNALSEQLAADHLARRLRVDPALRARRPADRARQGREDRPARHAASPSCPTSRSSRRSTSTARSLEQRFREMAFLTKGLRIDFVRRARRGLQARASSTTAASSTSSRYLHSQGTKDPIAQEGRLPGGRQRRRRGRGRDAVEQLLPGERCSRSPTTSTRTRAARTSRGFRSALTRTLNAYAREKGLLKEKEDNLQGEDVREGLTAIISVKLADPQFEGQTKTKLGNPPVEGFVQAAVNRGLAEFLEENPAEARPIINKARRRPSRAREAARKARDLTRRKSALENSTLPGQARRLLGARPVAAELFVVEGDSAGGSAKQGRDRNTQAILPLRGKIINAEKNRIDKVLSNNEIQALITAIGTGIREEFDLEKAALPQGHRHVRRRRGRRAHPHAGAHLPVPRDARPDRGRLRLPGQGAAVQGQAGQPRALHRERVRARGVPARATSSRRWRSSTATASRSSSPHARWQKFVRLLKQYEGWASALRAEYGHDPVAFLEESHLLDAGVTDDDAAIELLRGRDRRRASRTRPSSSARTTIELDRAQSSSARPARRPRVRLRREMFVDAEYRSFVQRAQRARERSPARRRSRCALGKKEDDGASRSRICATPCSTWPRRACACSASRASAR